MFKKHDKKERDLYDTLSITMELQMPLLEETKEAEDNKPKKSKFKIAIIVLVSVLLIVLSFVLIWINTSYNGLEKSKSALISNDSVEVNMNDNFIIFNPLNKNATQGLILFQGAKVDAKAYSLLARSLAEKGYLVTIIDNSIDLPILSKNKANEIIKNNLNIKDWVIGGHSLGGVVASSVIVDNPNIDALLLLASYPAGDELKNSDQKVLSIWGSKDGVMNFESFMKAKSKLPVDTTFVEIEGANHSQFGDYGLQKGDNEPIISNDEHLNKTVKSIVDLFKSID